VLDLASRFADGRLSAQKLVEADDEELARLLIEVRGIGRVRRPVYYCRLRILTASPRPCRLKWTGERVEGYVYWGSSGKTSGHVRHIFVEET
jgi:hypothetical protein